MKRWLLILAAVLVSLVLIAYVVGTFIPRNHVARRTIDLQAPPDTVWAIVSDFANTARWRDDVKGVRMDTPAGTTPIRFTESSSQGDVPFEVMSQDAPRRQVVKVIDDDQPFGGTWTWELEPAGGGTRLTITEAGFIKNPLFRAMGLLFFSPTATLESYLRSLAKALGETAEPRAAK
jgi:uncharacterized protein YndB with AHSA1/START domain